MMEVRHEAVYGFIRDRNPVFSWLDVPVTSDSPPFDCDACSEGCGPVAFLDRQLGLAPLNPIPEVV